MKIAGHIAQRKHQDHALVAGRRAHADCEKLGRRGDAHVAVAKRKVAAWEAEVKVAKQAARAAEQHWNRTLRPRDAENRCQWPMPTLPRDE